MRLARACPHPYWVPVHLGSVSDCWALLIPSSNASQWPISIGHLPPSLIVPMAMTIFPLGSTSPPNTMAVTQSLPCTDPPTPIHTRCRSLLRWPPGLVLVPSRSDGAVWLGPVGGFPVESPTTLSYCLVSTPRPIPPKRRSETSGGLWQTRPIRKRCQYNGGRPF